jgi:trimeric autotransporter adhesin
MTRDLTAPGLFCVCVLLYCAPASAQVVLPSWPDINTVAGDGTQGFSGNGGLAISAELNSPSGVAVDSSGNIYIADYLNSRIRKVTASTGDISTVAGNGGTGFSGDGGPATSATLWWPGEVSLDSAANIYIVDQDNERIRVVNTGTAAITVAGVVIKPGDIETIAGNGTAGFAGDGGAAIDAELNVPRSVALDSAGDIYIADAGNNRIRKVTASTGFISTIAGGPAAGSSGDGGLATNALLNSPAGVAVDTAGNVYIADTGNYKIRAINTGTATATFFGVSIGPADINTLAGTGYRGYNGDGIAPLDADLNIPTGVLVLGAGSQAGSEMYIADAGNERVRDIPYATPWTIYTQAGDGTQGYNGDNIAATDAELNDPIAVAFEGSDGCCLYIADDLNERIRAVAVAPIARR